jgi:PEP-CTERM motif
MKTRTGLLLTALLTVGLPIGTTYAGSLEAQSNPVANGAIVVAPLDVDRSDWAAITPYQADVDAITPVLSIESVSVAHDDNSFYFRQIMDAFDPLDAQQSFFGSHHAFFLDTDQDRSTGFIGGDGDPLTDDSTLAIGADYFIEGPAIFKFGNLGNPGGANQELFTWGTIVPFGFLNFDDSPPSDIEIEVSRADIGNPVAFDFIAYTTDISFATQDTYPNAGFDALGDYFTYSTLPVALDGDLDGDGFVGISDLNIVLGNWNLNVPPANPLADPSGDGFVGIDDLNAVLGNWNAGTPPASGAAVPEPASLALLGLGGAALLRRRA